MEQNMASDIMITFVVCIRLTINIDTCVIDYINARTIFQNCL